ncbi:MAG TPA: FemAB family XrtA/PEP-CTERM system-associated protein [Vicinamibacteria bacterium]
MRVAEWNGPAAEWDAFVGAAADGTVMHLHGWRRIHQHAYGHPTFLLAATEDGALRGVLPLTLVRSRLLGASLVSMPFMDYGGPCVGGFREAELPLVLAARDLALRMSTTLTLRCAREIAAPLPASREKATLYLDLGRSEEALWKRLPSERRNRVRKAQKHGLTASIHGAEALAEFFTVFATNMRDLGSPVHSLAFFRAVMSELGEQTRIVVVRGGGEPIGAGLFLVHGGMISMPWVSSLRRAFDKCPNPFLYWEVMRFGVATGQRVMDFGRSSRDSGGFEAKRQWGAQPVQLHWLHWPEGSLEAQNAKRLSWGTAWWRRLPVPVANAVGPWLRRGIPN